MQGVPLLLQRELSVPALLCTVWFSLYISFICCSQNNEQYLK